MPRPQPGACARSSAGISVPQLVRHSGRHCLVQVGPVLGLTAVQWQLHLELWKADLRVHGPDGQWHHTVLEYLSEQRKVLAVRFSADSQRHHYDKRMPRQHRQRRLEVRIRLEYEF